MLPKSHRLTLTNFTPSSSGVTRSTPHFNLKLYPSLPTRPVRIAFVVSKKTAAHSTDRNLLKRRFSAILQKKLHSLRPGHDLIFYPRSSALKLPSPELESSLLSLLTELKIITS